MPNPPLRYNISSWMQLPQCMSNNSRSLHITVTQFVQTDKLCGLRIAVTHPEFGTLFATVVDAFGDLISAEFVNSTYALTNDQILNELAKFGFYITYDKYSNLSPQQLQYLITLKGLQFDKIRRLTTYDIVNDQTLYQTVVVVFNAQTHGDWLNNEYVPKKSELDAALIDGSAINISAVSATCHYDWSWLDYVANIDDILEDNIVPFEG